MAYHSIKVIRLDDAGTELESFDMPVPEEASLRVFTEVNQILLERKKEDGMDFKFQLGQFVTTKDSKAIHDFVESKRTDKEIDVTFKRWNTSLVLSVISRRMEECPGGAQRHYLCRYLVADGYHGEWFNEIELVEHPVIKSEGRIQLTMTAKSLSEGLKREIL